MAVDSVHNSECTVSTIPESTIERSVDALRRQLRALGFWAAIGLPFLNVPLLLSGLDSVTDTLAFAALFALNLFALVLGHGHGHESR